MSYVKTYDDHHKRMGLMGSGNGCPEKKLAIISNTGLSGSCLDYGCGWGMMAPFFDDYVGCDISKTAISYAEFKRPDKEFHVIENGSLDLGRKFDFAICLSVFTHCLDSDVSKILSDLRKHTDFAVIDLIIGCGGTWEKMKRTPSVFGDIPYKEVGKIVSDFGNEHTYYKVCLKGEN